MKFEKFIEFGCRMTELSEFADDKGIVDNYYGQLKGTYKKVLKSVNLVEKGKYAVRLHRAKKEMFCASQMLQEAIITRENGCVIGYFFLCYYALFHSMQAVLFLNLNISNEEIIQLSHSKVEKYFNDFYCKGKKAIIPYEIIKVFKQLKEYREVYSYIMPLNSPENIMVDMEELKYYVQLCFQLLSLQSHVIYQILKSVSFDINERIEIKQYFEECCYRENPITEDILCDESDVDFWFECEKNGGVDFFPISLDLEHDYDVYGEYDYDFLEEMGFHGTDSIKQDSISFIYHTIV